MRLIRRHSSLTLAALLTLLLALARYQGASRAIPTEPSAHLVAPPLSAVAAFNVQTRGSLILMAKMIKKPAAPHDVRGARLRDKGEALGGWAPDRVDKTTQTLTAQ